MSRLQAAFEALADKAVMATVPLVALFMAVALIKA